MPSDDMTVQSVPSVVLPRFLLDGYRAELDGAAKDRAELIGDDDPALLDGTPAGLEVAVTGVEEVLFHRLVEGHRLRWVHSISAGVEHLPLARMAERGVLLTNSAAHTRRRWRSTPWQR
jgi:phosphoglycerate dehydrogenase-like enzyme